MTLVALATEDELSEAVGKRLLIDAGYTLTPSPFLRRNGFGYLRSKMDSWCEMAKRKPVVLLTDLDNTLCPVELRKNWMGTRKTPANLILRVAVREIEAWLLADHDALRAQEITKIPVIHLRHCKRSAAIHGCALRAMDRHGLRPRDDEGILVISTSLRTLVGHRGSLPPAPDLLPDPKQFLLRLIAKQARRSIREDLVAEEGAIASQGIGYNARLSELVYRMQQHQD